MSNPESASDHASPPERRAGRHIKPAAERHFDGVESTASVSVLEHLDRYGAPFAVYLQLPGVDASSEHLGTDFREVHWGSYDSMEELINEFLDGFNGRRRVSELLTELGLDPTMITWNYDTCETLIRQELRIVEAYEQFHAFTNYV